MVQLEEKREEKRWFNKMETEGKKQNKKTPKCVHKNKSPGALYSDKWAAKLKLALATWNS